MNREKFVNHLNRILEGKTLEEKGRIYSRTLWEKNRHE